MNAIGYITNMNFIFIEAVVHIFEHLSAYLSMNAAHTVHFLRKLGCENAHRKFLIIAVFDITAQVHESIPCNIKPDSIMWNIGTQHIFSKRIMTCRHRRMSCK